MFIWLPYQVFYNFGGPIEGRPFTTFFGGTCRSRFEIKYGKNSKRYAGALKKNFSHIAGLTQFSFHLGGIPGKSNEIPPWRAD